MAAVKSILILALALGVSGLSLQGGQHGVSGLGCMDDPSVQPPTPEQRQHRYEHEAMSPDLAWKMGKTIASIKGEDLEQCASCDEIKMVRSQAKKDSSLWGKLTVKKEEVQLADGSMHQKTSIVDANEASNQLAEPMSSTIKKIYYVSLDGSEWRAQHLLDRLRESAGEVPVEKFRAVPKDEASEEAIKEFTQKGVMQYVKDLGESFMKGTMAVYLSQARLMKHIHEQDPEGRDWYVIMEDDADPHGDWLQKVQTMLKENVPEDVDTFKFGYWGDTRCQNKVNDAIFEPNGPSQVGDMTVYGGNQAYAIRPKSIPKLLKQLSDMELFDVDGAMGSLHTEFSNEVNEGIQIGALSFGRRTKQSHGTWGIIQYVSAEKLVEHRPIPSQRLLTKPKGDSDVYEVSKELTPEQQKKKQHRIEELRKKAVDEAKKQMKLAAKSSKK